MDRDIRIYAEGLAFKNGVYDLRALEMVITGYRKVLDRLVAVQMGRRQAPKGLKSQLGYEVTINKGSIELLVKFLLEHKELLVGILAADGGQTLSQAILVLLSDAISLRKLAAEILKKGLKVKINININIKDSFNIGSKINSGNVTLGDVQGSININDPKILWAAQVTRAPVNDILWRVDGKSIEYIDMSSQDHEFRFTPDDREIIGKEKEELPTELTVIGRLDVVAFSSRRGSIVSNNERFSVTWDEQLRTKLQKVADIDGVMFKVRPVVDHKRLDDAAIGLHILDCGNPQKKLFG